MKLGMEIGLGPSDTVLDGDPAPPPKKRRGHSPQFSANNYCDQTARCIRIPLSTEVGLGPGDTVLDGDPASPPFKRAQTPTFDHVYCGQTTGRVKMSLHMKVSLGPGDLVIDFTSFKIAAVCYIGFSIRNCN